MDVYKRINWEVTGSDSDVEQEELPDDDHSLLQKGIQKGREEVRKTLTDIEEKIKEKVSQIRRSSSTYQPAPLSEDYDEEKTDFLPRSTSIDASPHHPEASGRHTAATSRNRFPESYKLGKGNWDPILDYRPPSGFGIETNGENGGYNDEEEEEDISGGEPPSKLGAMLLVLMIFSIMIASYYAITMFAAFYYPPPTSEDSMFSAPFRKPEPGWMYHTLKDMESGMGGKCASLRDRHLYYPTSRVKPSASFLKALRDYEKMHQRCVAKVHGFVSHFESTRHDLKECRYIVWKPDTGGLGNRFLALLSAFEYALLTNRALLIDYNMGMQELLCSPFPDSTFWIPPSFPIEDLNTAPHQNEFMAQKTSHEGSAKDLQRRDIMTAYLHHDYNDFSDENKFFCQDWQNKFTDVVWMLWESNQYVGPALFFIPSFEKKLLDWFPDKVVTTHIARYLLLPSDKVWERIVRVYKGYFAHVGLRVGLQVRTFAAYDPQVSVRVASCMTMEQVLPQPMTEQRWSEASKDPKWLKAHHVQDKSQLISLFVVSLDLGYFEYLKDMYTNQPTEDGRLVAVHVESHETTESRDMSAEEKAMVEIWLLSMSDTLFQSYSSTFGYIAQALCGCSSYFLNVRDGEWQNNGKPVCEKAATLNSCFHVKPLNLQCPNEAARPFGDSSAWLPYVRQCQDATLGLSVVKPSQY